jgi:hypothetical protein
MNFEFTNSTFRKITQSNKELVLPAVSQRPKFTVVPSTTTFARNLSNTVGMESCASQSQQRVIENFLLDANKIIHATTLIRQERTQKKSVPRKIELLSIKQFPRKLLTSQEIRHGVPSLSHEPEREREREREVLTVGNLLLV